MNSLRVFSLIAVAVVLAVLVVDVDAASPEEWKTRSIYQLMTDRFAKPDGSAGGSCGNLGNWCGGSFKGILKRLDYIQGMGFDAIWIGPIVENTDGGYHGYWAKNLYNIDPHLGTADDLKDLVTEIHNRGMYIMVGVVANHMGPVGYDYSSLVPFNDSTHYHDCSNCPSNCQIQDFNNQPQVEHCRLAGLPDLNQDGNNYVASTLAKWVSDIVQEYNLDGIRIDTVPEVSKSFWSQFQQAAGVYAVGEVFNGDVDYVSGYQPPLDAVLSYPMFFTLRDCFQHQKSLTNLESRLKEYTQKFHDPSVLGTFVDNHDNARFLNGQGDVTLYKNALTYVLTGLGIPIVYYGSEQQFSGGNDPNCREDLWRSNYNTGSMLYKHIAMLNAHRVKTQYYNEPQVQRYADDSFYAFTRGTTFVALTNAGSNGNTVTRSITYHPYPNGTKLCNLFDSNDCVTVNNGSFNVSLNNGQPKLYYPQ